MLSDKQRWNEKYSQGFPMPNDTSDILKDNLHLVNRGKALDIACGMGRNTHFLVDNGFLVDAVDLSDYALSQVREHENINKIETDLDTYQLEADMYDLIVKINYLERNLFPQIIKALKKDGVFIYETFVEREGEGEGYHPSSNPAFLLRKNEVPEAFSELEIISYLERDTINLRNEKVRVASFVGRKV